MPPISRLSPCLTTALVLMLDCFTAGMLSTIRPVGDPSRISIESRVRNFAAVEQHGRVDPHHHARGHREQVDLAVSGDAHIILDLVVEDGRDVVERTEARP